MEVRMNQSHSHFTVGSSLGMMHRQCYRANSEVFNIPMPEYPRQSRRLYHNDVRG